MHWFLSGALNTVQKCRASSSITMHEYHPRGCTPTTQKESPTQCQRGMVPLFRNVQGFPHVLHDEIRPLVARGVFQRQRRQDRLGKTVGTTTPSATQRPFGKRVDAGRRQQPQFLTPRACRAGEQRVVPVRVTATVVVSTVHVAVRTRNSDGLS